MAKPRRTASTKARNRASGRVGRGGARTPAVLGAATTVPSAPKRARPPQHAPSQPPQPSHRQLRGYAFDPSLATNLETALVSEIIYSVPWEPLKPGPIGEYVEVVDY